MSVGYKDLEIYKLAHDLAVKVHRMTLEQLPKHGGVAVVVPPVTLIWLGHQGRSR